MVVYTADSSAATYGSCHHFVVGDNVINLCAMSQNDFCCFNLADIGMFTVLSVVNVNIEF